MKNGIVLWSWQVCGKVFTVLVASARVGKGQWDCCLVLHGAVWPYYRDVGLTLDIQCMPAVVVVICVMFTSVELNNRVTAQDDNTVTVPA